MKLVRPGLESDNFGVAPETPGTDERIKLGKVASPEGRSRSVEILALIRAALERENVKAI